MIEKSDSFRLGLPTIAILGQPPREFQDGISGYITKIHMGLVSDANADRFNWGDAGMTIYEKRDYVI